VNQKMRNEPASMTTLDSFDFLQELSGPGADVAEFLGHNKDFGTMKSL